MFDSANEFLDGQPLYVKTMWWIMTVLLILWGLPWVAVALINPFWFRSSFFDLIESHAKWLADKRDRLLKPVMSKYKLFNTIKSF